MAPIARGVFAEPSQITRVQKPDLAPAARVPESAEITIPDLSVKPLVEKNEPPQTPEVTVEATHNPSIPKPEIAPPLTVQAQYDVVAEAESVVAEFEERQKAADVILTQTVKTKIQEDPTFTPAEQKFWTEKFDLKTQTAPQTQTLADPQSEAQEEPEEAPVQLKTGSSDRMSPPKKPIVFGQDQKEPEESKGKASKEPKWKVYRITNTWRLATKHLQERLTKAGQIITNAYSQRFTDPKTAIRNQLVKLDWPGLDQEFEILRGDLIYPEVSLRADLALAAAEEDWHSTSRALNGVLYAHPPEGKNRRADLENIVKQSTLVEPAREIAEQGAEYIVLRRGRVWEPEKRPARTNPIELDKVDEKAA